MTAKFGKGMSAMDFVIAAGFFIIAFALVVQTLTSYFSNAESTAEINTLTGNALSMLTLADYSFEPSNWTGNGTIERIGLESRAYTFLIEVNDSQAFLRNQSQNVTDLPSELVIFNYTDFGFGGIDVNSTAIYDSSGAAVQYNIAGTTVSFVTSVNANETKFFRVYFDDDSNFNSSSASVSGSDTIAEKLHPVYAMQLLQYKKIMVLTVANYTAVKSYTNSSDFRITLNDIDTGQDFFSFGSEVPRRGDVVALQRYSVFQNSTGGIRNGRLIVQLW